MAALRAFESIPSYRFGSHGVLVAIPISIMMWAVIVGLIVG